MGKPTVLAAAWFPGCGANVIVPPVKQLLSDGRVNVVVLGHGESISILAKAGIPFKTIADFGLSDVSPASMRKVLEAEAPDLVLMGTSSQDNKPIDTLEHSLTLAAREKGIKSLAIFDQWYLFSPRFTDVRIGKKLGVLPDLIAVPDAIALKDMLEEGFQKDSLVITGNPHFDNLPALAASFTEARRQGVKQKIGLDCQTLFFLAGNGFSSAKPEYGYWDLDVIQIMLDALSAMPNVGLTIRLHPRMPAEDKSQISEAIAKSGTRAKLVDDVDSLTLALTADCTFGEFSTVLIETVYMRLPSISLQPSLQKEDDLIVSKRNIIPVGYTQESCAALVKKAADPAYRAQILNQSANFATDGKATERVAQLVYLLLKL